MTARHDAQRAARDLREQPEDGKITPQYLTACVRDTLAGEDALFLTEAITNFEVVAEHLRASRPGSLIGSGGGSLGWAGGGAVGAKLAAPDRTVVCLVGDGSFLFGVPSSAQWVARRYGTPALTVIYNNRGWKAPKMSALAVHPKGAAAEADDFNVSFEPAADLPAIAAAAGGAFGANVTDPAELPGVLKRRPGRRARRPLRRGRRPPPRRLTRPATAHPPVRRIRPSYGSSAQVWLIRPGIGSSAQAGI